MDKQLRERLVFLVAGFLLTTLGGALWNFILDRSSWERQAKQELHQSRYQEGVKYLDELSELVGRRFFFLQRYYWAIEDQNQDKLTEREQEYFSVVKDWNSKFWLNRNKIRLLIDEDFANRFMTYDDDLSEDKPTSLHYHFVLAHRKILDAKSDKNTVEEAAKCLEHLNWKCSIFLEEVTTEFLRRASRIDLLKIPEKSNLPNSVKISGSNLDL
ncbi:MAG: hypothetical protein GY808_15565 [Gammaproteobacteria bacterium]|nr:hypothetical protein [Gammaproteobacteria bacterium]